MLKDWLADQLVDKPFTVADVSELLIRLLDYGIVCRDESLVEQRLYDRFVQCEAIVEDYLDVLGMRLDHNRRFRFVRVFPPGAQVPGLQDDDQQPFNGGFRTRLGQLDVALVLVLRIEYAKHLREGKIDDQGCVMVSMEALSIAFNNFIKRSLPENLTERRAMFRRLRQLRLVRYQQEDDLDSPEAWFKICPTIASFVSDEAMDVLASPEELEQFDASVSQDQASFKENPDVS